jgi:hypothetical protein
MFSFVKTAIKLIGGASSVYSIVTTVIVGGGFVWYYYNKYITVPVKTAQKATEKCYTEANKTSKIYKEVLRQSEVLINKQKQIIYDMEHNRTEEQIAGDIRLIECKLKVKNLERRLRHEKIDTSDEFFYTKLPF